MIKNIKLGSLPFASGSVYDGLFGYIENSELKNIGIIWTSLNSPCDFARGLVGFAVNSIISNSHTDGDITSTSQSRGICGYLDGGSITDSHSTGDITVLTSTKGYQGYAGGIAGQILNGIINCSYSSGRISTNDKYDSQSGGIVGLQKNNSTIINSYSTGIILTQGGFQSKSGGIVERLLSGNVINCFSAGDESSQTSTTSYSGGIVGHSTIGGKIINSYSSGAIASSYTDQTSSLTKSYSGGIMGFSDGTPNNCLGLNKSIISSSDSCYSKRIGYLDSNAIVNNNFASQSIIVKQNGNIKTNFTDIKSDGEDFNRNYTDFLNNYITTNSTFNEIPLKKWLIKSEVNNGFPFF